MTTNYSDQVAIDDLRASAIVLRYAVSLFLEAANAAGDRNSMAAGQSMLELLTHVKEEPIQLRTRLG